MKRVHLLRHAKSSWEDLALTDHQRPLKKRGRKDAALMAPAIERAGWQTTVVHCSSAVRAVQTLEHVLAALPSAPGPVFFHDALYSFDDRVLVDWLGSRSEDDITLVGHNPALHQLHEWLSEHRIENFPTCAYSQLSVDVRHWSELRAGCATLNAFVTPRMLKH